MKRREMLSMMGTLPLLTALPGNRHLPGQANTRKILVEAHRGNSIEAPENTMEAVQQAIELRVDRVEIDLEYAADGALVVIHDSTVDRTTNGTGKVADLTYPEIKELDAGSWKAEKYAGARVPLLKEVFEACKGKTMVNIDLKNSDAVPGMVKLIKKMEMEDHVVITGKIPECTKTIRENGGNLTMFYESRPAFNKLKDSGKSMEAVKLAVKQARQTRLPGFLFHAGWITPEIVHAAHLHGLALNVWDVNSTGILEKMLKAGVDSVMTDDPKMILTSI